MSSSRLPDASKKVAVYCMDATDSACPQIRLLRPLAHTDWQVVLGTCRSNGYWKIDIELARDTDLVIVQRNFPSAGSLHALKQLKAFGKPVLYDLDDAFLSFGRNSEAHRFYASYIPYICWMLRQADYISVSTNALVGQLTPHTAKPIAVQPNLVDWSVFSAAPRQRAETFNLLISGTPTHAHDWAIVEEPLMQVLEERRGRVIAHFFGAVPSRFVGHPSVRVLNFQPHYEGYARTLRSLDAHAAIVPLEATRFNDAKSNIKWLEYSAAGIPGIYSKIRPYAESIVDRVDGLLVDNVPSQWKTAIDSLIDSPEMALALAARAATKVKANFSIATQINTFEALLDTARKQPSTFDRMADFALTPWRTKDAAMRQLHRHLLWRMAGRS